MGHRPFTLGIGIWEDAGDVVSNLVWMGVWSLTEIGGVGQIDGRRDGSWCCER